MRAPIPRLSKSRFMAGLQCHKRLYLELYAPEIAAEVDETTLARFGVGTAVGELARQRFAGGRLIAHDHQHHADAEVETRALLDDPNVPATVRSRVQLRRRRRARGHHRPPACERVRSDRGEVYGQLKGAASLRSRRAALRAGRCGHAGRSSLLDASQPQLRVPRRRLRSGPAVHLRRPHGAGSRPAAGCRRGRSAAMREPLWADVPPPIATGPQCTAPYVCPFYDHCHGDGPEHPIEELPGRRAQLLQELAELGIADIRDIPSEFDGLTVLQARVRDAVSSRQPLSRSGDRRGAGEGAVPGALRRLRDLHAGAAGLRRHAAVPDHIRSSGPIMSCRQTAR